MTESFEKSNSKNLKENLREKMMDFPLSPGVYLMKNKHQKVIYVGKAKSLKKRVRSYLSSKGHKDQRLISNTVSLDYILTETEAEAFLLEASLIQKHRPKYNIRLKDDKSYPYIRLTVNETFPRFYLARKVKPDGSHYFGPYSSSQVVLDTIRFLNQSFQIRDCGDHFMKSRKTPCMTYQMGACGAPCVGEVGAKEYAGQVRQVEKFLQGESEKFIKKLKNQMKKLSQNENFELAAQLRDRIQSIEQVLEKQDVVSLSSKNQDALSYCGDERGTLLTLLHIRQGRVIGKTVQFLTSVDGGSGDGEPKEWLTSFITQYYQDHVVPDEIYLSVDLGPRITSLLKEVFRQRGFPKIKVSFPVHKEGQRLLEMAYKNAQSHFSKQVSKSEQTRKALEAIAQKFHLKKPPHRIECFDISHLQGEASVGSQVVSLSGSLAKNEYRRYKVKEARLGDDYGALREVLSRRLAHGDWDTPDLLLIDGGKGQLNAVFSLLEELEKSHIPVVGLAKERTQRNFKGSVVEKTQERFYLKGRQNPVVFPESSLAFKILVGLRDEAHGFALRLHRTLRGRKSLESRLDGIKGLGPVLKKKLLNKYLNLESLAQADISDLTEISGISKKLAQAILVHLET